MHCLKESRCNSFFHISFTFYIQLFNRFKYVRFTLELAVIFKRD